MKATKTIEVNICDQCGDEVQEWHIRTCPTCKKEICEHCVMHFNVTVQQITPSRQSNRLMSFHVAARHDCEIVATYCGPCGSDIERNLIAAGFQKHKTREAVAV